MRKPLPNFCSRSEDLQSFSWIFPHAEMTSYCGTVSFVFSAASETHNPWLVMLDVMQWFLKTSLGVLGPPLFRRSRNISCSGSSRLSPEPGPETHLCCCSSGCMEVEEKLNSTGTPAEPPSSLLSCGNWIFHWPFAKDKQN